MSAVLLLLVVGTACGSASPVRSLGIEPPTVAFFYPFADEYFHFLRSAFLESAEDGGMRVDVINTNSDAQLEAAKVSEVLGSGIDAVVMQPADSAGGSIASMKAVRAAGVPLICYGDCAGDAASPDVVDGVVQSDNASLGFITGKAAARHIKENLGGKASIGILNCDVVATCQLRKAGFKEALAAAGVEATYPVDLEGYQVEEATPVAEKILARHPEIDLLWASNQGGTEALVTASERSDGKVAVFGTDISSTLATALLDRDDPLQFTTGQDAIQTGRLAYEMASVALRGDPNDPFERVLAGIGFADDNPDSVRAYFQR